MEGLVVWSCLAILLLFHGILCDDSLTNNESINDERIKRNHESDCEKIRAKHELNKSLKTIAPIDQKPKTTKKTIIKQKLPINERNEPKNVSVINHILEEIANNHNETKGIHKIRHLVDEIDKQNGSTGNESKLSKLNKIVKTLKKEEEKAIEKEVLTNQLANEIKSKDLPSNNLPLKHEKDLEIVSSIKSTCPSVSENKLDVKVNEPTITSQRNQFNEETSHINDCFKEQDIKDNNLIEIEEHTYEEESLQTPSKYTQPNTYNNWYTGENYNSGFYTNNYDYSYGNDYNANCYPVQSYQTTYPSTYEDYNNGNYYTHTPDIVNPVTSQINNYIRRRKTWLDRDTIIDVKDPTVYQVKTMNEDKKEITSIHKPDFHRKYYSVTQKQYSSDVSKNQNMYYYINPYHCS